MLRMIHTVFPVLSTTRPCTESSTSLVSSVKLFFQLHPSICRWPPYPVCLLMGSSTSDLLSLRDQNHQNERSERRTDCETTFTHLNTSHTFKVYPISRKRLSNLTSICYAAYAALVSIAALLLSLTGIVLNGFARICEDL